VPLLISPIAKKAGVFVLLWEDTAFLRWTSNYQR